MAEVAEREVERGRRRRSRCCPRMQAITLEVILRAVFGLDEARRLSELRERSRAARSRRP